MTECNQSNFGFKACGEREVVVRFDGGTISSDAGAAPGAAYPALDVFTTSD